MKKSPSMHKLFLHFAQAFLVQVSHTALAAGRVTLEERLARWLLMVQDRMRSDEFALTHEFMALMLGVRRAGVTVALHELEGRALIKAKRGQIAILDREGMKKIAAKIYGTTEAEYRRLLGWQTPD